MRARIFGALRALKRWARIEELAGDLGVHPNSVRVHLAVLEDAGLVDRKSVPSGTGRPHFEWCVAAGALVYGPSPRAYDDLARWLARALETNVSPRRVEAVGRDIGREVAPQRAEGQSLAEALEIAFASMGFQPQFDATKGQPAYTLGSCPYLDAATEQPNIVCPLHKGITAGLLDALDPEASLERFVPMDPLTAGCLVVVRTGQASAQTLTPRQPAP